MLLALVVVPLALALLTLAIPRASVRPWLVALGGTIHLALSLRLVTSAEALTGSGWFYLDALDRLVLPVESILFAATAFYSIGYMAQRKERDNRIFSACLLAFLSTLTLFLTAHHLGMMWVAIEGCAISAAPLIYWNRTPHALEAVWKYLLVGSVGVAIALLGAFFLAYSALVGGTSASLLIENLVLNAHHLSRPWLHPAFILLFIGYGTKMGLAPMHAWKPDAYGEAPGAAGALLSGGLTTASFIAILRVYRIVIASGDSAFARQMMITLGLISMAIGGIFIARQRDYKRLLAYSSVEHMGILVFGVGLGGLGVFGALFHVLNNSFTKGVLFLTAGNLQRAYGEKRVDHVGGALRVLPLSASLFLAGFFAITGTPPFGPFQSEFTILRAAFGSGHYALGAAYLALLAVVFVGMGAAVLAIVQGEPPVVPDEPEPAPRASSVPRASLIPRASSAPRASWTPSGSIGDTFLTTAPPIVLLGLVLWLGLHIPTPLLSMLEGAARSVEVP